MSKLSMLVVGMFWVVFMVPFTVYNYVTHSVSEGAIDVLYILACSVSMIVYGSIALFTKQDTESNRIQIKKNVMRFIMMFLISCVGNVFAPYDLIYSVLVIVLLGLMIFMSGNITVKGKWF